MLFPIAIVAALATFVYLAKKISRIEHSLAAQQFDGISVLPFESNDAAFEYSCKYLETSLYDGATLTAIVLDAREELGSAVAVKMEEDGTQMATVKVASDDGGFLSVALAPKGMNVKPGELVGWTALPEIPDFPIQPGFIHARLSPELDLQRGWNILKAA